MGEEVANTNVGYWDEDGQTVWGVQWSRRNPGAHEFFVMQPGDYTAFISSAHVLPQGYAQWYQAQGQDHQGVAIQDGIERMRLVAPAYDSSL